MNYQLSILLFLGRTACGFIAVDAFAEDEKALIQEFRREIDDHIEDRHQVFVPLQRLCKVIPKQRGERREYRIVSEDLQHGNGYIRRRVEGELAVERKVPEYAEQQRDQVAGPIVPGGDLVEQRKTAEFNQACTGGEYCEFRNLSASFIVVPLFGLCCTVCRGVV